MRPLDSRPVPPQRHAAAEPGEAAQPRAAAGDPPDVPLPPRHRQGNARPAPNAAAASPTPSSASTSWAPCTRRCWPTAASSPKRTSPRPSSPFTLRFRTHGRASRGTGMVCARASYTGAPPLMNLDQSQLEFCRSEGKHVRLLAPAGCGKTLALLHRCVELANRAASTPRFLVVTFTKAATHELRGRLLRDPAFKVVKDHITISTLNALAIGACTTN